MLSVLLRPLRQAVAVLLANDSSRQIAAGVAIGMVLGLVPKGNLIALTVGVTLLALRVNRTAGLLSAAAFSWVAMAADPFFHKVGARLLTIEWMQPAYASLYELALGPWIGFNNTVVLGSLVVGLYLFYPCYAAAKVVLDRVQAPVAAWLRNRRVARWLLGAEITSRWGAPASIGVGT